MTETVTKANPTDLGRRIRQARIDADLTIAELAKRLKLDPRTVAGYQAGRSEPKLERLYAIAEATGKPPSYFIPDPETAVA